MEGEFQEIKNPLLASIFHWVIIVLLLAVVFGVSGSAFLLLNLRISDRAAMNGTNAFAIGVFIFGGILGVLGVVWGYLKQDYW